MRAVTLNETRRLAPRDIRRQKRRTSPTSIIMCATFEEEKDKEKETSFCVQSLYPDASYSTDLLPTYPLNKEPLHRAGEEFPSLFLPLYGCRCLLFFLSLFPFTYFSRGGGFRANGCIFTKATCTHCLPTCDLSSLPVTHYGWPPRLWHINFTCFWWSRTYKMIHKRRVKKVPLSHEIA